MDIFQLIKSHRASVIPFLIVGAMAAIINFATFSLAIFWMNYEISASFAFITSVVFHFNANRIFTFKQRNVSLAAQLPKYLSMVMINYLLTLGVMYSAVNLNHLSPYIANVMAIGVTVGIGYVMSKYWVFAKEEVS